MKRTALLCTSLCFGTLLLAAPFWEKKDFSQWTTEDAKKLLSNSPWAKTTTLHMAKTAMQIRNAGDLASATWPHDGAPAQSRYLVSPDPSEGLGSQMGAGQPGGAPSSAGGQQPSMGGPQRPSMGQEQPGQEPQAGGQQATSQGAPVVVEWESATPIRLAELKLKTGDGQPSQSEIEQAQKPTDSYIVALVGVPGKPQENEDKDMAVAATITPKNKQAIQATSAKEQAIDNGTRAIIFTFPKSQPITLDDKTVEFKLAKGPLPTEVKQNFKLKDMQYKGNLAL